MRDCKKCSSGKPTRSVSWIMSALNLVASLSQKRPVPSYRAPSGIASVGLRRRKVASLRPFESRGQRTRMRELRQGDEAFGHCLNTVTLEQARCRYGGETNNSYARQA